MEGDLHTVKMDFLICLHSMAEIAAEDIHSFENLKTHSRSTEHVFCLSSYEVANDRIGRRSRAKRGHNLGLVEHLETLLVLALSV